MKDNAESLTIAIYGAQARKEADLEEFRAWAERVNLPNGGRGVTERARFVDKAGWLNEVRLSYWRDAHAFSEWQSSEAVCSWWEHQDRLEAPVGVWREIIDVPTERLETILSAPTIRVGSGRVADFVEGPIEEHGYWGSMRDRLPISKSDPLLSAWGEELQPRAGDDASGRRIIVDVPGNIALIRSGQDAARCSPEELQEYTRSILPVLKKGMDYLRDHPVETGCCCCRFMNEIEVNSAPSARSFGFAWFLTLDHLERWSKSHPTHLAIYNVFSKFAAHRGSDLGLELWHEVAIVPAERRVFEYVNCHSQTGMLGFFDQFNAA